MANILVGVTQRSGLRHILFLIHINDLPEEITSICNIFAYDTFKVDKNNCITQLNSDLELH